MGNNQAAPEPPPNNVDVPLDVIRNPIANNDDIDIDDVPGLQNDSTPIKLPAEPIVPVTVTSIQATPECFTDCYDIVIDIDLLSNGHPNPNPNPNPNQNADTNPDAEPNDDTKLDRKKNQHGWPVYLSPKLHQKVSQVFNSAPGDMKQLRLEISKALHSHKTILSVSGLFNRGKTFFINKLAGVALPSDRKVSTRGLSFLMPDNLFGNDFIMLDTAGTSSPIAASDDNALTDKKSTELFLQDVIFEMSDISVIVVNELTWPDEELIRAMWERVSRSKKKRWKTLFVVHNFLSCEDESELLVMWQRCVLRSYLGTMNFKEIRLADKVQRAYYYVDEKNPIYHLFLAKEGSAAGDRHNDCSIELFRQLLSAFKVNERQPFLDEIDSVLNSCIQIYCKSKVTVSLNVLEDLGNSSDVAHGALTVRAPGLVSHDDWMSYDRQADLQSIQPNYSSVFYRIDQPIELTRSKIIFDGYRIILGSDGGCSPPIDVIEDENGLVVVMDLAGFYSPNETRAPTKNGMPVLCGYVTASLEPVRDEPGSDRIALVIKGERKLWRPTFEKLETGTRMKKALVYDCNNPTEKTQDQSTTSTSTASTETTATTRLAERQGGSFKRVVLFDQSQYAITEVSKVTTLFGTVHIFLAKRPITAAVEPDLDTFDD